MSRYTYRRAGAGYTVTLWHSPETVIGAVERNTLDGRWLAWQAGALLGAEYLTREAAAEALENRATLAPSSLEPMPLRSVRVPDALWIAAGEVAADEGRTLSEVIREALERYAAG